MILILRSLCFFRQSLLDYFPERFHVFVLRCTKVFAQHTHQNAESIAGKSYVFWCPARMVRNNRLNPV